MINNNLFLTLIVYFSIVCLSVVLVTISGLVYLTFIPIALSLLFTFLIIRRIDKSIKELTRIVSKASRGDFSGRYITMNDWEIEPLGLAVTDLLENISLLINDYKADRQDLKILLSNISEALWIQNKNGILIWTSHGFDELFPSYQRNTNLHYWEVILEPELLDFVKISTENPGNEVKEIKINDSYYLIKGIFNPKTDTNVFIMQNIDALKHTEQMKKNFMVNLAHELRTPLTAIKGFSEILSSTATQENMRYVNIIRNHTERLINLVSDLQTLSSMERLPDLKLQPINLSTFLENIKALYSHTLEERGLYLIISSDSDIPKISVDPFKFEQIFINLIDNALRYTLQGGIEINIVTMEKSIRIVISDTGQGIEAEHLPRIFERFYVADPSRNRSLSGTGLGLAIVKHSVLLHQGTIEVQSETGKGTCFIMNFPRYNI